MSTNTENNDMNSLTFQDLVILKQFLEKGVREDFFNRQELTGVEIELNKLTNIINGVIQRVQENSANQQQTQ